MRCLISLICCFHFIYASKIYATVEIHPKDQLIHSLESFPKVFISQERLNLACLLAMFFCGLPYFLMFYQIKSDGAFIRGQRLFKNHSS